MIHLKKIAKHYQISDETYPVLTDIDLDIQANSVQAIVGPSGSGKSTLMNLLGLLDTPSAGQYLFNDQDVSTLSEQAAAVYRNRDIGFVFQQFYLLPRLTVLDNVCLPLQYTAKPIAAKYQTAMAMHVLQQVGIADKAKYLPAQLSGGQQQRVAIARALINKPKLILADEPTGALDSQTSQQIMQLFFNLQQRQQSTLVIITHDEAVAALCPRQIQIQDGRIAEDSTDAN